MATVVSSARSAPLRRPRSLSRPSMRRTSSQRAPPLWRRRSPHTTSRTWVACVESTTRYRRRSNSRTNAIVAAMAWGWRPISGSSITTHSRRPRRGRLRRRDVGGRVDQHEALLQTPGLDPELPLRQHVGGYDVPQGLAEPLGSWEDRPVGRQLPLHHVVDVGAEGAQHVRVAVDRHAGENAP